MIIISHSSCVSGVQERLHRAMLAQVSHEAVATVSAAAGWWHLRTKDLKGPFLGDSLTGLVVGSCAWFRPHASCRSLWVYWGESLGWGTTSTFMRWPGNTLTVISTVLISDTAQEEDDREPSQKPAGAPQKLPLDTNRRRQQLSILSGRGVWRERKASVQKQPGLLGMALTSPQNKKLRDA